MSDYSWDKDYYYIGKQKESRYALKCAGNLMTYDAFDKLSWRKSWLRLWLKNKLFDGYVYLLRASIH